MIHLISDKQNTYSKKDIIYFFENYNDFNKKSKILFFSIFVMGAFILLSGLYPEENRNQIYLFFSITGFGFFASIISFYNGIDKNFDLICSIISSDILIIIIDSEKIEKSLKINLIKRVNPSKIEYILKHDIDSRSRCLILETKKKD